MSCLAPANLRLLLPNGVISPIPSLTVWSPPLHSHYWCSCRMNYQLTAPKLHKYDSNKRCLADYLRWFFQRQLYFPLLTGASIPFPFSPPAALFQSSFSLSCRTQSDRQTIQLTSLLFKSGGRSEDEDPQSGAPFVHSPPAQQRSKRQNKNPYNSRYLYWTRKPGCTKIYTKVSFAEIKFPSRPAQKSSSLLRGRRNCIRRPRQTLP